MNELRFRGVDAFSELIDGDPGEMEQKEANKFMKSLTTKIY